MDNRPKYRIIYVHQMVYSIGVALLNLAAGVMIGLIVFLGSADVARIAVKALERL